MSESKSARKVLIIPSWYPSLEAPTTGVFVREQAKALARHMEVSVLAPRFPSLQNLIRLRFGPAVTQELDEGIDTWRIRKLKLPTLRRWIPFLHTSDHVLVYYRKFASAVRQGFAQYLRKHGRPDVLHAHVVLPAGWVAVELGKQAGVPVVLTEHSEPFDMHLGTPTQRALVREILGGCDQVIAVSSSLRDTLKRACPNLNAAVVGNIIDTEFFTPAPRQPLSMGTFRFLALGLLTERKGIQFLLQAAHALRARGATRFEVYVGGEGPYRAALEEQAHALDLRLQCRFLGLLNRAQVCEHMQTCDVFVLPSLGETFGVVLGEALACGKPVIATRCGGPSDVVTADTGVLVPPADPVALADAMACFLRRQVSFEPELVRSSVIARFGVATFVDRMSQLYGEVMQRRQGARCAA